MIEIIISLIIGIIIGIILSGHVIKKRYPEIFDTIMNDPKNAWVHKYF